jgi:hypothetical protein
MILQIGILLSFCKCAFQIFVPIKCHKNYEKHTIFPCDFEYFLGYFKCSLSLMNFFVCSLGGIGSWTQGLMLVRQADYVLSCSIFFALFAFSDRPSVFAWPSIGLWSFYLYFLHFTLHYQVSQLVLMKWGLTNLLPPHAG